MVESLRLDSHFEDGDTRAQTVVSLSLIASSSRWCAEAHAHAAAVQHSASSAKFSC